MSRINYSSPERQTDSHFHTFCIHYEYFIQLSRGYMCLCVYVCVCVCVCVCVLVVQSYLTLCDPMDVACLAPLSMEFSRQEYGVGSHCLLQGIFPTHGSNPGFLHLQADSLPSEPPGKPIYTYSRLAKVLGTKRMIISRPISVL